MRYKTLAITVIIALSISLLGVIISISMIQRFQPDSDSSTGKATSAGGEVTIGVNSYISITADDALINFTGCKPNVTIYSSRIYGDGIDACTDFIQDGFIIRNDGTLPANVSVNFTNRGAAHGGTFLQSSLNTSWAAYKVWNYSTIPAYDGGCRGEIQTAYANITDDKLFPICNYLQSHEEDNSIRIDIGLFIPPDIAANNEEFSLEFIATATV